MEKKKLAELGKNVFEEPESFLVGAIWITLFSNSYSMEKCLGRIHIEYEHSKLKGPLKGINLPITVLEEYFSAGVESEEENWLYSYYKNAWAEDCPVKYLVACLKGDRSTLLHELSHGKYYLDH